MALKVFNTFNPRDVADLEHAIPGDPILLAAPIPSPDGHDLHPYIP